MIMSRLGLGVAAATLLAMAGCASNHARNTTMSSELQQHDAQLVSEVKEQLAENSQTGVIVTASHGKIELTGTVGDSDDARRAVRSALSVEGVRGVLNDLKIGTVDPVGVLGADTVIASSVSPAE